MIKSSNKRVKLLEVGSNVRIPILYVDRAPSGPTSLVGVVPDVSSTGNTFRLGTQHGQIPTWFSHSDVTPYGSDLLLSPSAVPDVELSVGPRPDRRSDQPVLSVTTRHRAHLSAAVAISRDLGRAVSLVEARDCHALPSISPFWSAPHDTTARVYPLMSPTCPQQPLPVVRAACCLLSPSPDSIAHSHLLSSVHRNVALSVPIMIVYNTSTLITCSHPIFLS